LGVKRSETRSWSTNYRGPLAIHAAKSFPVAAAALVDQPPFNEALNRQWTSLPIGAIVATGHLADVVPAEHAAAALRRAIAAGGDSGGRSARELAFGDYTPGRYAWLLECVAVVDPPIPARGALSLWTPLAHPVLELAEAQLADVAATGGHRCVECGCTDNLACDGCCWWATVDPPVCSTCADKVVAIGAAL
jgi:activating signal cointegrator 1